MNDLNKCIKSRTKFLKTVPDTMKNTFEKAFSGASKATALKAKCLECSNFQRKEVTECKVFNCPLHDYRPFQKDDSEDIPEDL